jgi:hypothetical protein
MRINSKTKKKIPARRRSSSPAPFVFAEDVHVHIGGTLVLRRYVASGTMEIPTDPEHRRAMVAYLKHVTAELEACS